MIRTGTPITSHHLLEGVTYGGRYGGAYRKSNEKRSALKNRLQNSKRRKAPITLPNTPFDHKGDKS